ncbi:homoserine O-acetyltransferase domain protein [Mycobacterium xenopi 3993]|nr:homoserine O-acetyltransferase domain protein [Mycobacterium xenopi 3993]
MIRTSPDRGPGHPTPGWWDGVAAGAPIDTNRWCAIATNVLAAARLHGPAHSP